MNRFVLRVMGFLVVIGADVWAGTGCGPDEPASADGGPTLEIWRVVEPALIGVGVVDGEDGQLFFGVRDAVSLADGGLMVLDGGSRELRHFGPDGQFLGLIARRGEGPADLGAGAARLGIHEDTVEVIDVRQTVALRFLMNGDVVDDGAESGTPLRYSAWLSHRTIVETLVPEDRRGAVDAVLRRLPAADTVGPWRTAIMGRDGRMWITAGAHPTRTDPGTVWTVYEPDGTPIATAITPVGLRITDISSDRITGVLYDDNGVEFIRVHQLNRPVGSSPGPGPVAYAVGMEVTSPAAASADLRLAMNSATKNLSTILSIYYMDHAGYPETMAELQAVWPDVATPPDGVRFELAAGTQEGYIFVASDRTTGAFCSIGEGDVAPPGLIGRVTCTGGQ